MQSDRTLPIVRSDDNDVHALRRTIEELQAALETRVIIEQAKGIVAVNDRVVIDVAFDRLRRAARNSRQSIRDIAIDIVASHESRISFSPR